MKKLSTKKKKEELLELLYRLGFSVEIQRMPNQNVIYLIRKGEICKLGGFNKIKNFTDSINK